MKKNTLITLGLSVALGVGVIGAFAAKGLKSFTSKAVECDHVGYHYDVKAATKTDAGWLEFWTCCKCHEHFDTQPEGTFEDATEIYSGSTPEELVLPAGTKYYAKGAQITDDASMDPQIELSAIPATSAISFDFWMKENGSVGFSLFDKNNWKNVLGNITFTKSDSGVTATKGVVTAKTNNWYNIQIARGEFNGDGLADATNIGIVSGLWDGEHGCTVYNAVAIACNWASFTVVENFVRFGPANDDAARLGYSLTEQGLANKALSFDAYFEGTGDQALKIGIYKNGWSAQFIVDLFIYRTSGQYTLKQFNSNDYIIPIHATDLGDGWVNFKINAIYLTIVEDYGDSIVVWRSPTTAGAGVDLNSFKVVDLVEEDVNEIAYVNGNFKSFVARIRADELIRFGALSFNVKVAAGSNARVSFDEAPGWANCGTTYFDVNADGDLTVKYKNNSTPKGAVTKLADGWFNVVLNEYEFDGDGRSANNAQNITHIYCENANFSIDASSIKYCAPHAQTGTTYGAEAINFASWAGGEFQNFAYDRSKIELAGAGLAFEAQLVGDGTIQLALFADTWDNISGEFTITKSGDEVTSSYNGARIIARADGWYSIYIPGPWNGDGYARESWTAFAIFYSSTGYSGTSITINRNSFHMFHNGYLPA